MSISLALSAPVGGEVLDSHLMMYVNYMCVCPAASCPIYCVQMHRYFTQPAVMNRCNCDFFFSAKPAFFAVLFMPA